jgi:ornithine cyclodeaminase/alanine dehydrogenase-like protein (mu-crystallin family)
VVRILDAEAVARLLDDAAVLSSVRELFTIQAEDRTVGFGRIDLGHPGGWLRSLPGYIAPRDVLGFKVLHQTRGVGMRYTIYVHRLSTGELTGILDGLEVTNMRTGAVTAVATDLLAPRKVEVAAIVGTGPVARGQLRALEMVRPAAEIRVFARTPENRSAFVTEMSGFTSGRLLSAASLDEAVDEASMVTLATKATAPILLARHLRPGMHVNSVGPASLDRVEVDPAAFGSFDRVVCDSVDLVLGEAGDAQRAVASHGWEATEAVELSHVVTGSTNGRMSEDEITLFKSVGNGAQDLIVAAHLLELAEAGETGSVVPDLNAVKPTGPSSTTGGL